MHGAHAFCPESGSTLSEETIVLENGREVRYPTGDNAYGDEAWALTTGARCSSRMALMSRFRECHERTWGTRWVDEEATEARYRRVALAIRQLKRENADVRDEWIWFALAERLHRLGDPVDWMYDFADLCCPACEGPLQWLEAPRGTLPVCVNRCPGTKWHGGDNYVHHRIRDRIATVYNRTFDDPIDSAQVTLPTPDS